MITLEATTEIAAGVTMPNFGLGVFRAGDATYDAVRWALDAGYRHIDTARIYRNEADVGRALRESDVDRAEVFVTTKLWNDDQGYEKTKRAFDKSLDRLGLEYVDLYLMHWPVAEKRLASWRAMEEILDGGRTKAIGVSNFTERHLDELLAGARIKPAVNQFELHPLLPQPALVEHCRKLGVTVEAYSPLAKAQHFDEPAIVAVAEALGKSPAQVMIRWGLEKGFVVIPKSQSQARIHENMAVFDFELGPHLAALDAIEARHRCAWDPNAVP